MASTSKESNGQACGAWCNLGEMCFKLMFIYDYLIVAILSGSEFQYVIVLGSNAYL